MLGAALPPPDFWSQPGLERALQVVTTDLARARVKFEIERTRKKVTGKEVEEVAEASTVLLLHREMALLCRCASSPAPLSAVVALGSRGPAASLPPMAPPLPRSGSHRRRPKSSCFGGSPHGRWWGSGGRGAAA